MSGEIDRAVTRGASRTVPFAGETLLELLESPGRLSRLALLARPSFEVALGEFTEEQRLSVTHGVLTALRVSAAPKTALEEVRPPELTVRAARPGPRGSMVWLEGPFRSGTIEAGFFEATGLLVGDQVARAFGRIPPRATRPARSATRPAAGVELKVGRGLASRSAGLIADTNPIHHDIDAARALGIDALPLPALAVFALAERGFASLGPRNQHHVLGMLGFRITRPVIEGQVLRLAYSRESNSTNPGERRFGFAGRSGHRTAIKAGEAVMHGTSSAALVAAPSASGRGPG